jgi:hypothetical protein
VQEVLARVLHALVRLVRVRLVPERHVRPALEVLPRVTLPNVQVSRITAIVPRESQASASRMESAVSVRVVRLVRVRVVRVVRVMVRVVVRVRRVIASRMGSAVSASRTGSVRVVRLVRVRVVRVVRVMDRVVGPPDAMTGLLASVKSVSSVR